MILFTGRFFRFNDFWCYAKCALCLILCIILYVHQLYADDHSLKHESFITLSTRANWNCLELKVTPIPIPQPPYVVLLLDYLNPSLFIETTKNPGDFVISEAEALIADAIHSAADKEIFFLTDNKNIKVTSVSQYSSLNGSNLQFNEVHLFDFPGKMVLDKVLCPSKSTFGLRYLSELDAISWRKNIFDATLPITLGSWGPINPRIGFMVHFSSLTASALTGIRAISIAHIPQAHFVINKLDFGPNIRRDKIQMVYPSENLKTTKTSCIPLGADLSGFNDMHSKDSRYVWIYWHHTRCLRSI